MLALLTALTLFTAPVSEVPQPFLPAVLSDLHLLDGAGGDLTPSRGLAFVGLSAVGTSVFLAGMPLLGNALDPLGQLLLLVPVAATIALQVGLARLLDLDVSWASAGVGSLFGVATGVAVGLFCSKVLAADQTGFGALGYFVIGSLLGYAIGAPIFTLLDPFDLAGPDDSLALPLARPPGDAGPEAIGTGVTLWGARF